MLFVFFFKRTQKRVATDRHFADNLSRRPSIRRGKAKNKASSGCGVRRHPPLTVPAFVLVLVSETTTPAVGIMCLRLSTTTVLHTDNTPTQEIVVLLRAKGFHQNFCSDISQPSKGYRKTHVRLQHRNCTGQENHASSLMLTHIKTHIIIVLTVWSLPYFPPPPQINKTVSSKGGVCCNNNLNIIAPSILDHHSASKTSSLLLQQM
jgi:hypothetical protein